MASGRVRTESPLVAELAAVHGTFVNGTYVIGVNVAQIPEQERPCPVCKTNRMLRWRETTGSDPKPEWWKCERVKYDDVCAYAIRANDFPAIYGIHELDGAYSPTDLKILNGPIKTYHGDCFCEIGWLGHAVDESGHKWIRCVDCKFCYPAKWRPQGVLTAQLKKKRQAFMEASDWYNTGKVRQFIRDATN